MKALRYLPNPGLMDTVWVMNPKRIYLTQEDFEWPKLRWLRYMFCPHAQVVEYGRIDHRAGPGALADSYEGTACALCGRIIHERIVP